MSMLRYKLVILVFTISFSLSYQSKICAEDSNDIEFKEWKIFALKNPFGIPTRGEEARILINMQEVITEATPQQWLKCQEFGKDDWMILYKKLHESIGPELINENIINFLKHYRYRIRKDSGIEAFQLHFIIKDFRIAVFCVMEKKQIQEIRIYVLQENQNTENIEKILATLPSDWEKSDISLTVQEIPHENLKTIEQYNELVKTGKRPFKDYYGVYLHLDKYPWR